MRDALERVQANVEAKDRFLAMMSHELRTPLQSVLGYADLLLRAPDAALNAEQREDLGAIHRGAARMVTLIDQNLDLSRIKAGHLVLERASVDLGNLLRQVCQDLSPEADAKGITLQIDGAEVPPIVGDLGRVYQILLNLAGNAVKFTPRGEVRLAAGATETGVAVTVRDTGIGIDPVTLEHIFEEYHQGEGGRGRRFDGTGLGLAIASRLANDMEGRITVESEVDQGSCFTLHLPLAPAGVLSAPG